MFMTEVYGTAITGLEAVACKEAKEWDKQSKQGRGFVTFFVETDRIMEVLSMRSVDNLYAIVYEDTLSEMSLPIQEEALKRIQNLIRDIDWLKAIKCWQISHKKELFGGIEGVQHSLKNYIDMGINTPISNSSATFRVTCNRVGERSKHSFSSMDAARTLGSAINNSLGWKADMKDFQIELVLNIRENHVRIMIALHKDSLFKRNICSFGPTTLRSTICYCMLSIANPLPGDLVLDAMCGGGSICLEGSIAFPQSIYIGGDYHQLAIERCQENKAYIDRKLRRNVDFCRWDATNLPFNDATIDVIVTDLPFGQKIGSVEDNRQLYPLLIDEWERIIKPGGRLVVLTKLKRVWEHSMIDRDNRWKKVNSSIVNVGGLSVLCSKHIRI